MGWGGGAQIAEKNGIIFFGGKKKTYGTGQMTMLTSHTPHPSPYRRDHDQPQQEADDADEEQQQLSAVASSEQVGVQVGDRRHQGL